MALMCQLAVHPLHNTTFVRGTQLWMCVGCNGNANASVVATATEHATTVAKLTAAFESSS